MNRRWIVASHEFWSNFRKPSFLFGVFGVPFLMGGLILLVSFVAAAASGGGEVDPDKVAYVDEVGILADAIDKPEAWQVFDSQDSARAALDARTIEGYFVVNADYMQSGTLAMYSIGTVNEDIQDDIEDFVKTNIAQQTDSAFSNEQLVDPVELNIVLQTTGREMTQEGFLLMFLTPIVFMTVFMVSLQISSAYLMSSVSEEKTNRVMEILITTLTPNELLSGKIIGLGGLALFQISVWIVFSATGFLLSRNIEGLQNIDIPWDMFFVALVYFLITYFMYGSLLAGVGAITDSEQESRQIAGLLSFVIVIPLFFVSQFLENASGTIPTLLSYFPFTSGMSMLLRVAFTPVTPLEIIGSLSILIVTTMFIVWASAKVFHWSILMYGKRASLREVLRVVRGNPEIGGAV
jgi:ABC-2 type transport system permease protein